MPRRWPWRPAPAGRPGRSRSRRRLVPVPVAPGVADGLAATGPLGDAALPDADGEASGSGSCEPEHPATRAEVTSSTATGRSMRSPRTGAGPGRTRRSCNEPDGRAPRAASAPAISPASGSGRSARRRPAARAAGPAGSCLDDRPTGSRDTPVPARARCLRGRPRTGTGAGLDAGGIAARRGWAAYAATRRRSPDGPAAGARTGRRIPSHGTAAHDRRSAAARPVGAHQDGGGRHLHREARRPVHVPVDGAGDRLGRRLPRPRSGRSRTPPTRRCSRRRDQPDHPGHRHRPGARGGPAGWARREARTAGTVSLEPAGAPQPTRCPGSRRVSRIGETRDGAG